MQAGLTRTASPSQLLARLIETPDLARTVRALPASTFSSLVRHVGVADAGELVALATTEQLVQAFDEDLFTNAAPGERETFDGGRFAVWLEVLLEAGEEAAANRVAELSEDFVAHALSSLVLVLDEEALRLRMDEYGDDALRADKAIESALCEEIDGYLLFARSHEGWDAALALILALDRDHRALLERLLSRCAALDSELTEDLDELTTVLSEGATLAGDVEAEREERRARQGYVEPRAARGFLLLAREPLSKKLADEPRDPITRAFFREFDGARSVAASDRAPAPAVSPSLPPAWVDLLGAPPDAPALPASSTVASVPGDGGARLPFIAAMELLRGEEPARFAERMAELGYLANVLLAGAAAESALGKRRLRPAEAAEAALATVMLGAELELLQRRGGQRIATPEELSALLRAHGAELLFRRAGSALTQHQPTHRGFLLSRDELVATLDTLAR